MIFEKLLMGQNNVVINTIGNFGDILCAREDGTKTIVSSVDKIPNGFTAIGIVVIPSSHNVYGDGKCCVMSLNFMSASTPDTGTTISYAESTSGTTIPNISWGATSTELTKYAKVPNIVTYTSSGTVLDETLSNIKSANYGFFPSDYYTDFNNCLQSLDRTSTYSYYGTSGAAPLIPSPYNADGSRNQAYYYTGGSLTLNGFSDFSGFENTQSSINMTSDTSWKTSQTIIYGTNGGKVRTPAAACCWRYHTTGTNQGDWYCPSLGELGYILCRVEALDYIKSDLDSSGKALYCGGDLRNEAINMWSSTRWGTEGNWYATERFQIVDMIGDGNVVACIKI